MSLQAILETIENRGATQLQVIASQADLQAREIISRAQLEAAALREQACHAALEPATRERARLIQRARLEALHKVGETREALVDLALDEVGSRLARSREQAGYPEVLRRLIRETLLELEISPETTTGKIKASLDGDPRDRNIIEGFLGELGLDPLVDFDLACWGGLIGQSEDGRVVVVNTLEARLERATPFLRTFLAAYFESEDLAVHETRLPERSSVF